MPLVRLLGKGGALIFIIILCFNPFQLLCNLTRKHFSTSHVEWQQQCFHCVLLSRQAFKSAVLGCVLHCTVFSTFHEKAFNRIAFFSVEAHYLYHTYRIVPYYFIPYRTHRSVLNCDQYWIQSLLPEGQLTVWSAPWHFSLEISVSPPVRGPPCWSGGLGTSQENLINRTGPAATIEDFLNFFEFLDPNPNRDI